MTVPEVMPTLGRGRHRNPRRGACFMEMASYLAGERWSDHPRCTHSLLAALARLVNDNTPDADRQQLAPMIPSVIGLDSDDPRWDVVIARRAAAAALPIASESRQRALAVGLLTCARLLAQLDGRSDLTDAETTTSSPPTRSHRYRWRGGGRGTIPTEPDRVTMAAFRRYAAPSIVLTSVAGIAESCANRTARGGCGNCWTARSQNARRCEPPSRALPTCRRPPSPSRPEHVDGVWRADRRVSARLDARRRRRR